MAVAAAAVAVVADVAALFVGSAAAFGTKIVEGQVKNLWMAL